MSQQEFSEFMRNQCVQDYVVRIRLKYDCETEWTYINELLLVDDDCKYMWFNDWHEGQQQVEILGYIPVDEISDFYLFRKERAQK